VKQEQQQQEQPAKGRRRGALPAATAQRVSQRQQQQHASPPSSAVGSFPGSRAAAARISPQQVQRPRARGPPVMTAREARREAMKAAAAAVPPSQMDLLAATALQGLGSADVDETLTGDSSSSGSAVGAASAVASTPPKSHSGVSKYSSGLTPNTVSTQFSPFSFPTTNGVEDMVLTNTGDSRDGLTGVFASWTGGAAGGLLAAGSAATGMLDGVGGSSSGGTLLSLGSPSKVDGISSLLRAATPAPGELPSPDGIGEHSMFLNSAASSPATAAAALGASPAVRRRPMGLLPTCHEESEASPLRGGVLQHRSSSSSSGAVDKPWRAVKPGMAASIAAAAVNGSSSSSAANGVPAGSTAATVRAGSNSAVSENSAVNVQQQQQQAVADSSAEQPRTPSKRARPCCVPQRCGGTEQQQQQTQPLRGIPYNSHADDTAAAATGTTAGATANGAATTNGSADTVQQQQHVKVDAEEVVEREDDSKPTPVKRRKLNGLEHDDVSNSAVTGGAARWMPSVDAASVRTA
jgi:hypothetical protein